MANLTSSIILFGPREINSSSETLAKDFVASTKNVVFNEMLTIAKINATRFGEILPLWQILWQFLESLFCIWNTSKLILSIFYAIGQIFIDENGQKLKNN